MMRLRRIYYYYLFINFFLNDKQTLPGNHWKKLLRISLKRTVVAIVWISTELKINTFDYDSYYV